MTEEQLTKVYNSIKEHHETFALCDEIIILCFAIYNKGGIKTDYRKRNALSRETRDH